MTVDWTRIYMETHGGDRAGKFQKLPTGIPWTEDLDENLRLTAEWLVRDGKKEETKYAEEDQVLPVRDNWFKLEFDEGHFLHVCYPEEILSFRRQYESLHWMIRECNIDGGDMAMTQLYKDVEIARTKLWSAWNCMGGDGMRREPADDTPSDEFSVAVPYSHWEQRWTKQCSRCCCPLPKSLQMWVKLQHSKLKDAL